MNKIILLMAILVWVLFYSSSASCLSPWEYSEQETRNYLKGMQEIQWKGWGSVQSKVLPIIQRLINDTGEVYNVVPGQTFAKGVAHAGGWIILDISTTQETTSVLAFWLAHEWAHEHLGHQPNWYKPDGNPWRYRPLPSSDEDTADIWAGKFLARHYYQLEPVLTALRATPNLGTPGYSSPESRAANVRRGYRAASSAVDKNFCNDQYEECIGWSDTWQYSCELDEIGLCADKCVETIGYSLDNCQNLCLKADIMEKITSMCRGIIKRKHEQCEAAKNTCKNEKKDDWVPWPEENE